MKNWLFQHREDFTSQDGEDGVLKKIFEVLDISVGLFVDVGSGDVHNSNTVTLKKKGWVGVFIDKDARKLRRLHKVGGMFINKEIFPRGENSLDSVLDSVKAVPSGFDLLDIDIDGNDYYVWASLEHYSPKIVLIEFNPCIKLRDYLQDVNGKGGCSLSMLIKLGKEKGYELIGATHFNAFFARKDLFEKFRIDDNSIQEMFVESDKGYGRDKTDYSQK